MPKPTDFDKRSFEVSQSTGIPQQQLQPFSSEDPFNPGNILEGFISLKPNDLYGALIILSVSGWPCFQLIRATPKLHYPFGRDGVFHFPQVRDIHIYEKIDGSNILSYAYSGEGGSTFVSHKLRLAPFVRNSKWGAFLDMWREVQGRGACVDRLVKESGCNISSELYGAENEHLVKYSTQLDFAVLFGVDRETGEIKPPFNIDLENLPSARLLGKLDEDSSPIEQFAEIRSKMESNNAKNADGKIIGTEGCVWYIRSPGDRVTMWKCKPESVEEIHWATGINKAAVIATCWNAFETSDHLDFDTIYPLLAEEYQQDDIIKFRNHIDECILQVENDRAFRSKVKEAYNDCTAAGLDLLRDKGAVMRSLSAKFPKEQMSRVYGVISR